MKRLKRLLAVIMAIICAGSIANFDVKAEGLKINEKHKKAKIIREIKELKTKTSSTYQLDNGARLLKVNLGSEDFEMEKKWWKFKENNKGWKKKIKRIRCAKCKQLFNEQFFRNQKELFSKRIVRDSRCGYGKRTKNYRVYTY